MLHKRRSTLEVCLLAGVCIVASSLSASVLRAQMNPEKTVQIAIKDAEQGIYEGILEKMLGRLGDASAVAITKLFADKQLADTDIRAVLLVVRLSYG
jgi:hypothetical protein